MSSPGETRIIMLGSTGAVGSRVARIMATDSRTSRLTLLGRRALVGLDQASVVQHEMDIHDVDTYRHRVSGHGTAICTLAVWPWLSHLFFGPLAPYRSVPIDTLALAIARNVRADGAGVEVLDWRDFRRLAGGRP